MSSWRGAHLYLSVDIVNQLIQFVPTIRLPGKARCREWGGVRAADVSGSRSPIWRCAAKLRDSRAMQHHPFGPLPPVSVLTLGGGGLGMLWGATTFDECVATVHAAVAAGISLLDLAPRYGDGKAEEVVGAAFAGKLPPGVRVTSKCNLGNPPADQVDGILRRSIEDSLRRLRLSRLDLFFLHCNVAPDGPSDVAQSGSRAAPDAVRVVRRSRAPGVRTPRGRGPDRRLGPDRHRPSRHDHQAAGRAPRAGRGAMHRQSAGFARRAEILRRPGATARRDGGGARQRRRRDGHPRGAGRRADRRDRPAVAGRSSGDCATMPAPPASARCAPSLARTRR